MTNSRAYVPFAAVALLAGVLGWGVSAYSNKQTAEAMPANLSPLALTQPQAQTGILPDGQVVALQPVQAAQPLTYTVQPLAPIAVVPVMPVATTPVARTASVSTQPAPTVARNSREDVSYPAARKKGMSNKAKTAIAVGAGAGVGAAIGGIAKGGKGAAIGAIAGSGAAAVYSWIKHKKNQPVF